MGIRSKVAGHMSFVLSCLYHCTLVCDLYSVEQSIVVELLLSLGFELKLDRPELMVWQAVNSMLIPPDVHPFHHHVPLSQRQ